MNSPPDNAPKKRVFKVAKIETPAAPAAPAKMSVSRAEAVKQIKAYKEKESKVSSMAAKVKERKAIKLLKALVVARRAKKAATDVTPTAIFTSLWEGEPSEKNSIRFKSAASNADIIKAIRDHDASYQSYAFTISTSSNGSRLITPSARSYQEEAGFKRGFNRKAWVAYRDADGDKYSAAEIERFKPTPAPLAPPKTKEELFQIIGAYVKTLTSGDYQEYSRYSDSQRSYRIPKKIMPENVRKAVDALMGLKVDFQTIGEKGGIYQVQPTPDELAIVLDTQDNWAREYVYRDAFYSVGYTLSDRNEYLPEQIKEIYKGAYKKYQSRSEEAMRDAEIDKLDVKNVEREFLHNFKDPVKVKKLVDELNQITRDSTKREQEITAMMTKIPAPKGTKAQIIELIREMVTNPVDRLKLRLDYRDKGTLQTIYMNTKARYDWYKKNKPGQGIDYYLD
jgi:hypothetical protein